MKRINLSLLLGLLVIGAVLLAGCDRLADSGKNSIGGAVSTKMLLGAAVSQAAAGLTQAEKDTLLANHNDARAKYAQYNDPPMTWDDNLAAMAQKWAEQIAATGEFKHEELDWSKYGQDLWGDGGGGYPISRVVSDWIGEGQWFDLTTNTCNAPPTDSCGHFRQVVSASTTAVGCGKATGTSEVFVVCDYSPPGSFGQESLFCQPSDGVILSPYCPSASTNNSGASTPSASPTDPNSSGASDNSNDPSLASPSATPTDPSSAGPSDNSTDPNSSTPSDNSNDPNSSGQ